MPVMLCLAGLFLAPIGRAADHTPPRVEAVVPAPSSTLRGLHFVRVIFSESVTGVDATDLHVNGQPADTLEMISAREYTFRFPEPPAGPVDITWSAGHGITDLAPEANALAASGWSYVVDPTVPLPRVILSEFLADNDHGIRDEDGERSDWIELRNLEETAVDLTNWSLSDDPLRPDRWRFPEITLPAGGYLLVWASGKDRRQPGRPLHTNFQLANEGEFLGLFDPAGNAVSAFAPAYPPQYDDISYGRDLLEPEVTGYFPTPTPGKPNVPGGPGFAAEVRFDPPPGLYATNRLVIRLNAPSGRIHYTLNGTEPTEASPTYEAPLVLTSGTVVRARVYEPGLLPGPPAAAGYVLAPPDLEDFDSNLPLLVIQPATPSIPQDRRAAAWVIALEPFRGRAALMGRPSHQSLAAIEIRGQSSTGFPKKQYNLELNDPAGLDLEAPLLGLPEESDWVLNGPYTDKSLLNNVLAFELHEKMGHYAPRRRFCEVFIDQTRAQLNSRFDYRGVYVLLEKIKIDRHRVDLARLGPDTVEEPAISGGYLFKKDKDSPGDRNFTTRGGAGFGAQRLKFHDPKPDEITPAQQQWLRNHLIAFEEALYAPDWLSRTGERRYTHYIDVASFVDNHWIVEFSKQIDGYRLSNYFSKDRGGPIRMEPIWDWNLSFGNANYLQGERPQGWYWPLINANQHIWLRRLIAGTPAPDGQQGDPDFNQAIADRWSVLRTNILAASNVLARIDELAALLAEAVPREFARWPRLDTYVWPNPPLYIQPSWERIIANKKEWIRQRFDWIDRQFLQAPTLNRQGGPVPAGFKLRLEAPSGLIWYRLDGRDPRAPGGGVTPGTMLYRRPFPLTNNVRLVARVRSGTRWSGPTAATFVTHPPRLRVAEIMFHPAPRSPGSSWTDEDFEFIELLNAGPEPLRLDGWQITGGVRFTFAPEAGRWLAPGERVVVAAQPSAFRERYGEAVAVVGPWEGRLANEGETIRLVGPMLEEAQTVRYHPEGFPAADGPGFSLLPAEDDPARWPAEADRPSDWRAGWVWLGTPGAPDPPPPALPPVVVNEVLANPLPPARAAIELHNPADTPADVSGWFLSDDPHMPKYRLPEGSVIPPGGFLVVTADQFHPGTGQPWEFGLDDRGDDAFLFSADADGRLTGRVHGLRFGACPPGLTYGRWLDAAGRESSIPLDHPTLGGPNATPRIGPVVMSEIMYHPPEVFANGRFWDAPENEYLELLNVSDQAVLLHDPAQPDAAWALRGGIAFTFPPGTRLDPGERLLVVGFDPAADPDQSASFRTLYDVPESTRLLGPWTGKLDNRGEAIELVRPEALDPAETPPSHAPVVIDRVAYEDRAPWPAGADGAGAALQRQPENAFGDSPASWFAATPTPGRPALSGPLPRILQGPSDAVVAAGRPHTLEVRTQGNPPLRYQWRRNDENLPGATEPRLTLTGAPADSGRYTVVVANAFGAVESDPATVRVVPVELDTDADGITDLYELTYGLNPVDSYDDGNDPDADGLDNLAEFVAGTDPQDASSRLHFERIELGVRVALHFRGAYNRAYRVDFRPALTTGAWQPLFTVPVADPADLRLRPLVVTDPVPIPPPAARFYRLVALPPP